MAHRVDPNRGVFTQQCDFCPYVKDCRLVMCENRYLWACKTCRTEQAVLSMGTL